MFSLLSISTDHILTWIVYQNIVYPRIVVRAHYTDSWSRVIKQSSYLSPDNSPNIWPGKLSKTYWAPDKIIYVWISFKFRPPGEYVALRACGVLYKQTNVPYLPQPSTKLSFVSSFLAPRRLVGFNYDYSSVE